MPLNVYNIPSGIAFAESLAGGLLAQAEDDPARLADIRVLLPTRRACRTLREAFLRRSKGKPLILPRMQPLGDIDEDELVLELAGRELAAQILNLPPALTSLERRLILAEMVTKLPQYDGTLGYGHAMALAGELGRLMDQVYTEGLSLSALPALVIEKELAGHWNITVKFLEILSEQWPGVLKERGVIDAADRRDRLIRALAAHWREHPPQTPVVAAGSTGSIPATAALLRVIAALPQGAVVLPGLDAEMDDESWKVLDDAHPQATLKHLLTSLDIQRGDVNPWPFIQDDSSLLRRKLAGEMMRPAATSERWTGLSPETLGTDKETIEQSIRHHVMCLDCETPEEEARTVSVVLRHMLDDREKTAALITPDRTLARRVAMTCRRWGLEIDDSAGTPLSHTPAGSFLRLALEACLSGLAPGDFLALLRHKLCAFRDETGNLEKYFLRGLKPPSGFAGLRLRIDERAEKHKSAAARAHDFLTRIEPAFAPLFALCDGGGHSVPALMEAHIRLCENLAGGADNLWRGVDGEEASRFLARLKEGAEKFPAVGANDYLDILDQLMRTVPVRSRYGTHPRLFILGQLEARMAQADLVVMAGLNEKTWPPDAGHDPWMSRPMRKSFGLPPPERAVGLAAHDFVQGFCAPRVVMTRARRVEGAPAVPARWLLRLDTVLQALGVDPAILHETPAPYLALARHMDISGNVNPCPRPQPRPPAAARPKELPVTQIETWLSNPYGLYAKYVLGLRKLDDLEKTPDAATRGTFLHDVLNDFIGVCEKDLPANAADILIDIGFRHKQKLADDSGTWDYWWPRFERLAHWLAEEHEPRWRQEAKPCKREIEGRIALADGAFTLTARADRIDVLNDGRFAIVDYKSGGNYTITGLKTAAEPQLPLEALILDEGGFPGVSGRTGYIGYWKLTGGRDEGKDVALLPDKQDEIETARDAARAGLENLARIFADENTPYIALPDPGREPRFDDYRHLARVQEWSYGGEGEDAA